jgi:PhnB protein
MRFMILVKATKDSEAGKLPSRQLLADMGKFNQELMAAGVMIDGGGLHPSSKGARVTFSGNDRTVTKGPFAQTNELVSGYWIWKLNSLDEAIAWVKRCPKPMIETSDIEIRQFYEMEDFAGVGD